MPLLLATLWCTWPEIRGTISIAVLPCWDRSGGGPIALILRKLDTTTSNSHLVGCYTAEHQYFRAVTLDSLLDGASFAARNAAITNICVLSGMIPSSPFETIEIPCDIVFSSSKIASLESRGWKVRMPERRRDGRFTVSEGMQWAVKSIELRHGVDSVEVHLWPCFTHHSRGAREESTLCAAVTFGNRRSSSLYEGGRDAFVSLAYDASRCWGVHVEEWTDGCMDFVHSESVVRLTFTSLNSILLPEYDLDIELGTVLKPPSNTP